MTTRPVPVAPFVNALPLTKRANDDNGASVVAADR